MIKTDAIVISLQNQRQKLDNTTEFISWLFLYIFEQLQYNTLLWNEKAILTKICMLHEHIPQLYSHLPLHPIYKNTRHSR